MKLRTLKHRRRAKAPTRIHATPEAAALWSKALADTVAAGEREAKRFERLPEMLAQIPGITVG